MDWRYFQVFYEHFETFISFKSTGKPDMMVVRSQARGGPETAWQRDSLAFPLVLTCGPSFPAGFVLSGPLIEVVLRRGGSFSRRYLSRVRASLP